MEIKRFRKETGPTGSKAKASVNQFLVRRRWNSGGGLGGQWSCRRPRSVDLGGYLLAWADVPAVSWSRMRTRRAGPGVQLEHDTGGGGSRRHKSVHGDCLHAATRRCSRLLLLSCKSLGYMARIVFVFFLWACNWLHKHVLPSRDGMDHGVYSSGIR